MKPMKAMEKFYYSTLAIMVLTIIHHLYGAMIYDQPFRLHVAYLALPVIVIQAITYYLCVKNKPRKLVWLSYYVFLLLSIVVPVLMIGLYEGGFNHVVKNILFFSGASEQFMHTLYPPDLYESPNNFVFEFTGIFQFVIAIYSLITGRFLFSKKNLVPHRLRAGS